MEPFCPVCRAPLKEPACYRCKADLSTLFELKETAESLLASARAAYREGSCAEALNLARQSLCVCRTDEARALELLLLFRLGERDRAFWLWRAEFARF